MTKTDEAALISEKLAEAHPNAGCELNYKTPYELLVAVILSAQCTDERVNKTTEKLFEAYDSAEKIAKLSEEELISYIYSCGFYRSKARNIIKTSKALAEKYGGEVPCDFEKLTELPGVGRKTASVVLSVAFDVPAVPVDTHVFRVARRLGISAGNTPEAVERDIKNFFPEEKWNALHHCMIFHGRYVCRSRKPACGECGLKDICEYFKREGK